MKKIGLPLLVGMLFLLCLSAQADTLRVDGEGFPSLTAALAAAQDGDEIVLPSGVYDDARETFPILVDKRVTIRGEGESKPVIRVPILKTGLRITAPGVVLDGLDIQFLRYGVWALADEVTIQNCAVTLADEAWRIASCGIWFGGCKRAALLNTTFNGCGIAFAGPEQTAETHGVPVLTALFEVGEDIEFFTTHTIENNTVNGKPLRVVIGLENADFSQEAGQVVAVQCANTIFHDMDLSGTSIGLQMYYCEHVTARKIQVDDSGVFGVYVAKTEGAVVEDCSGNGSSHGFDVRDVKNTLFRNCQANDCGQGIFLSWGHNSLVTDCEMLRCGTGFFSASGSNNHLQSSVISGCELGMYIQHEPVFTVSNTRLTQNSECGTRVTDTGLIAWDNVYQNNFVGVMGLSGSSVLVKNCGFSGNSNRAVFVKDSGPVALVDNQWDEGDAQLVEFLNSQEPLISP